MISATEKLLSLLSKERNVFIQTHDFPDPDAIAAAFGLQYFLKEKGIKSTIIYAGELQTNPVESMIKELGIVLENSDDINLEKEDKIIIIDGCKGNKNVANEKAEVIAVIDHHLGNEPGDVPFVDIRNDYGSSSTIIALYIQENKVSLTSQVATALAVGIHVDTNSFQRRVHPRDIEMFSFLYNKIDPVILGSILRNNVFQKDLIVYEQALKGVKIDSKFAFYHYPEECSRNLLGILANFFLAIEEVEFVVLTAYSNAKIIFSIRSENPKWNAANIIKTALQDLGAGGGHKDMAGGAIKDVSLFNEEKIYQRFRAQLGI